MTSAFGIDHGDFSKAMSLPFGTLKPVAGARRAPGRPVLSGPSPAAKRRKFTTRDSVTLKAATVAHKLDPQGNPLTSLVGRRLHG